MKVGNKKIFAVILIATISLIIVLQSGLNHFYRPYLTENRTERYWNIIEKGLNFLWNHARSQDITRLDCGLIINYFNATDGKMFFNHNDDAMTTGKFIMINVLLYTITKNTTFLTMAERTAQVYDPEIVNGVVFSDNDDPTLYVHFKEDPIKPEPGMVYWGFNGSHWIHPSDEQALASSMGLYYLWDVTRNQKYARWLAHIANYYGTYASPIIGYAISMMAYNATKNATFLDIAKERYPTLEAIYGVTKLDRSKEIIGWWSHTIYYRIQALHCNSSMVFLRNYIMNIDLQIVQEVQMDIDEGIVYMKRAKLPNGTLVWYNNSTYWTELEKPGNPHEVTGVQLSRDAMVVAVAFLEMYHLSQNKTYAELATKILEHYNDLYIHKGEGDQKMTGAFRLAYNVSHLTPNNVWRFNHNLATSQGTINFIWAASLYIRYLSNSSLPDLAQTIVKFETRKSIRLGSPLQISRRELLPGLGH